jgi:hypothetical protein
MSRYYRTILATLGDNFLTNLVAYWAFENNVNDALGVHNGTTVGSPTYTTGKNNQAIDFGDDTVIRYVDFADSNDFSFTDGVTDLPFSISFWVNFSTFTNNNFLITKRQGNTNPVEWQIARVNASQKIDIFLFSQNSTANSIAAESNNITTTNTWFHCVVTYNGSSLNTGLNIYINGLNDTANRGGAGTYVMMSNTTSIVTMGRARFSTSANNKHRGLLDEVAIWKNRELTASEVTKLYNAGAGKFYPF